MINRPAGLDAYVEKSRKANGHHAADTARQSKADAQDKSGSKANMFRAVTRCLADIPEQKIVWSWPQFIPSGNITVIGGIGGVGKGFWWADIIARGTTDGVMPDGSQGTIGDALLIVAEDSIAHTIGPRCRNAGADSKRITILDAIKFTTEDGTESEICFTLEHVSIMEAELERNPDIRWVVVDPIGSFIGGRTDSNTDNAVRAVLVPLQRLADKYNVAVIVVAHHRKTAGGCADDMILGSRAFTAVGRASFHIFDEDGRKLFLRGKANLSRERHGLAYIIENTDDDIGRVSWMPDKVGIDADAYLAERSRPGPEPESRKEAADWLRDVLSDGPKTKSELQKRLKADGAEFTFRTVRRALKDAGAKSERNPHTKKFQYRLLKDGSGAPSIEPTEAHQGVDEDEE